jgi:hypothetical protein
MERSDWTLLVIAAAAPHSLDPVQLQKCLFLLGKNCPQVLTTPFYNFRPYNFGPFDSAVYLDAEHLETQGRIAISRPAWRNWGEYSITPAGIERVEWLRRTEVNALLWEYLCRLVEWARSLSFESLVRTIYQHYPEFRENSVFREG